MFLIDSLVLLFDNLGNLRHIVVQVACAQGDEHVEIAVFHQAEHVILLDQALLYAGLEIVVDEVGGHSGNGLFPCRVNLCEYNLIEMAQRIGKVLVEIVGTTVQVRSKITVILRSG